jgi:hypothetical protein
MRAVAAEIVTDLDHCVDRPFLAEAV